MAFPVVSLLDSLQREAEEKPLSNGEKWALLEVNKETATEAPEAGACAAANAGYRAVAAFATKSASSYWKAAEFSNPNVVATMHTLPGTAKPERYSALYCSVTKIGAGKFSGYRVIFQEEGTAGKFLIKVQKFTESGAYTTLAEKAAVLIEAGDLLGLSAESGKVKAWTKHGAEAWTVRAEAADSAFNKGFVGIGMRGNEERLWNFEAGSGKKEVEKLNASVSPAVTSTRATVHALLAEVSPTAVFRKALAFVRSIAASVTPSATTGRAVSRSTTASMTPTGSLRRVFGLVKALTPSVSPAAALQRATLRSLTASLTPAASMVKALAFVRTKAASLAPAATLTRAFGLTHTLPASLTPAASLTRAFAFVKRREASLAPSASLTKSFALVRVLQASLAPAAILRRVLAFIRTIAASLAPAGSSGRAVTHPVEASVSPSASARRIFELVKVLSASILPEGSVRRHFTVALLAALAPVGSMRPAFVIVRRIAASLAPGAGTGRATTHGIEASLIPAAAMVKVLALVRTLLASLSPGASVARRTIARRLAAALLPSGALEPNTTGLIIKRLVATMTPSAGLTKWVSRLSEFSSLIRGLRRTTTVERPMPSASSPPKSKLYITTDRDDPGAS